MQRIAILGPGLLGGSLALKLRALGGWHIALWTRRAEAVREIQTRDCADEASTDLAATVREADLIVLCTPVTAMAALAREIAACRTGAIVTDVGSVKAGIVAELSAILGGRFVGAHPMAGKETSGLAAADATLFDGTTCIVTPDERTDAHALETVSTFWRTVGCRVISLPAREHDECVALISHLPVIVASALIQAVAEKCARSFEITGPGFRDTTRVASGPPGMWAGILRENATAVTAALDALMIKLTDLRTMLATPGGGDQALHEFLIAAKRTRDQITFPK